ncbi:MAG: DUF3368 domain-containing protein [Chloroherpetonaceae bacterium]|nr:DUF3368 domain-containing protein [Chloroherpetonaceae bacterium]
MSKVVCDTSCLIFLEAIDSLNYLNLLFEEILITKEVAIEFGSVPSWINVNKLNPSNINNPLISLGKGESSSIRLALEIKPTYLILDDKKARKEALKFNLSVIGSLGVLLIAKKNGLMYDTENLIEKIRLTNFRINSNLLQLLKDN